MKRCFAEGASLFCPNRVWSQEGGKPASDAIPRITVFELLKKLTQVNNFLVFDKKFSLRFLQMRVNRPLGVLRDFPKNPHSRGIFSMDLQDVFGNAPSARDAWGWESIPLFKNGGIEAKHRDGSS